MEHIKLFGSFNASSINENKDCRIILFESFADHFNKNSIWNFLNKVQIFSSLKFQDVEEIIGRDMKNYWVDFYDESDFSKIDKDLPLLFWRNQDRSENLLAKGEIPKKSLIYNHPEKLDKRKKDLAIKAQKMNAPWFPKTVFSKEDLVQLKFPIIAKKDDSYQSKGVEKIDTRKDLGNKKFDVYQECIEIKNEYRIMIFKGNNSPKIKAFGVWHRIPINKKSKSLRINESESKEVKSKFKWVPVSLKDFENWKGVKPIARAIFDFYPNLNFVGLDIAVDVEGKVWCIEHNETPGMVGNSSIRIYKYIFEDCFGKKIPKDVIKHFQEKAAEYYKYYKGCGYVEIPRGGETLVDLEDEVVL